MMLVLGIGFVYRETTPILKELTSCWQCISQKLKKKKINKNKRSWFYKKKKRSTSFLIYLFYFLFLWQCDSDSRKDQPTHTLDLTWISFCPWRPLYTPASKIEHLLGASLVSLSFYHESRSISVLNHTRHDAPSLRISLGQFPR